MTILLIIAFIAALLTAAYVLVPYFSIARDEQKSRRAENIEIFKQRLTEIEQDVAEGKLDKEQFDIAEAELKQTFLSDVTEDIAIIGKGNTKPFVVGMALILFVVIGGYIKLGGAPQVDRWQQAQAQMPELGYRAVMQEGEPLNEEELKNFALGLRTKLSNKPDDVTAWLLLGRVNMSLRLIGQAMQSFEKALEIDPFHLGASISYAQALVLGGQEGSMAKANRVLSRARSKHTEDVDLITLHAMVLSEVGNVGQAKKDWEWLLTRLDPSSQRYKSIDERLQALDNNMMAASGPHGQMPATTQTDGQSSASVTLTIEKSDAITTDNHVLFVFAKPTSGSPMPVAVKKLVGVTFPLTVTLTDADAMTPAMSLSGQKNVIVTARLSADEDVMPSEGDFEGISAAFDPHAVTAMRLTIDAPQGKAKPSSVALSSAPVAKEAVATASQNTTNEDVKLSVTVSKAANVNTEHQFLFVFAKIPNGPPMPVAVKKLQNIELPITVTLSDADAMLPAMKLSMQSEVVLTARLSADENVFSAAGEWQGESKVIDPRSTSSIEVIINKELN